MQKGDKKQKNDFALPITGKILSTFPHYLKYAQNAAFYNIKYEVF